MKMMISRKPKIDDLEVSVTIQQKVLRFQIPEVKIIFLTCTSRHGKTHTVHNFLDIYIFQEKISQGSVINWDPSMIIPVNDGYLLDIYNISYIFGIWNDNTCR